MSWLYSIVVAGLFLASGGDTPVSVNEKNAVAERSVQVIAVDDVTDKFEKTYTLTPNGKVSVSNINGSIAIEAWDRGEVRLEATKVADSAETLNEVEIIVTDRPDSLKVETDYKGWRYGDRSDRSRTRKLEVHYKLSVPRTAVLSAIETVNGSVTVANFVNFTKASAVNGNVNASNLRGNAELSTVNGEVSAAFERVEAGSRISLNTVNGRANLTLPSDVNATIKADSLNGVIANDFGLPVKKGEYIGRNLHGRLGNGEAQVRLNSVNGGLSILRQKDGRTQSPATNLLKEGDVGEVEAVDEAALNSAIANRAIARAMRDSERSAAVAMKEAQIAISKVKPELEKIQATIATDEMKASIKEGMAKQAEVLAQLAEINWRSSAPTIKRRTKSFEVNGTPRVVVEANGCDVIIRGGAQKEVRYVLSESGNARTMSPANISEEQNGPEITIKVSGDASSVRSGGLFNAERVRLEIYLPRESNVKVTSDGEIRLSGVSGTLDVKGSDSPIDIRDSQGKLTLDADDGQVRVIGFNGEFESNTIDANVFLEGAFERISSKAEDGVITLTLPDTASASLTSNSEIETFNIGPPRERSRTLRLGSGDKKYDFEFANGKLLVRSASALDIF